MLKIVFVPRQGGRRVSFLHRTVAMELSCLITLRPTAKFTAWSIITLQEAALNVVLQADVVLKASTTMTYSQAWQTGIISRVSDSYSEHIVCPVEPARPVSNDAMKPIVSRTPEEDALETKKLKSMQKKNTYECTIHAIANAESYAIDLFWDLIARYTVSHEQDAESQFDTRRPVRLPRVFYDEMVFIANQEAEHFMSWHRRLQELGYPFGTFPLSKGLWQSAGDTSDNLLARLAIINLTHEAKGLDTYAYTKEKFTAANDTTSLQVLDHNFKEEIHHVATGLKWFKYVCGELGLQPLEEFHALSRKHFKGKLKPPFNVEARNVAGLTEEWYMPLT